MSKYLECWHINSRYSILGWKVKKKKTKGEILWTKYDLRLGINELKEYVCHIKFQNFTDTLKRN